MTTTTAAKGLAAALVAFQKDAPKISFDAVNPHFKNKYASLAGIMETVLPATSKAGLAISQMPCTLDSGMPGLRTILMHSSGESIEDVMPLAVDKPGPQAQGSALTYARRYAILAILGLVADEDDDANTAQAAAAKPAAKANGNGNLTAEQKTRLEALKKELLAGGHITQEQIDSATSDELELLGRLERYAGQVGAGS